MLVSHTHYFLKILFSCFNHRSSKINYFINKLEIMFGWFAGSYNTLHVLDKEKSYLMSEKGPHLQPVRDVLTL